MVRRTATVSGLRHRTLVLAAFALATCTLAACGGSEENAPLVTGSFVGAIPNTDLYVAVVAAKPENGQAERAVRVYVCDGKNINEWFPGRGDNSFEITSSNGKSHVDAELEADAASGALDLPGGRSVSFRAPPATGIAGLFESMLFPDGTVRGSSETGVRLEGKRITKRPDASGRFKATGTYVQPNGKTEPWVTFSGVALPKNQAIASRIIVLADGRRRGGFKIRPTRVGLPGNDQPQ